jgi:hypothetical protein
MSKGKREVVDHEIRLSWQNKCLGMVNTAWQLTRR